MKISVVLLFMASALTPISASAESCTDWNNPDCRKEFIHENLPVPLKPDLSDPHDDALSSDIKNSIDRARMLMKTEKELDAQLAGINNPAPSLLSG